MPNCGCHMTTIVSELTYKTLYYYDIIYNIVNFVLVSLREIVGGNP